MTTPLRSPHRSLFLSTLLAFVGHEDACGQVSLPLAWTANPEANVAGYRIHYGTSSGNYTFVHDAGNATATTLQGLAEGEVYYCALSAYDVYGLESKKSLETSIIAESLSTQVVILEPEEGTLAGALSVGLELDASFQPTVSFIDTLSSPEPGSVTQEFVASTSTNYSAWVRVKSEDSTNDLLGFSVNATASETYDLFDDPASHTSDWVWRRIERSPGVPETFSVSAGANDYLLEKVSPGVLIDRVILTSNFDFVPSETLLSDEDFIIITQDPSSVSAPAGSPLVLTVGVLATETPSYQWMKDGTAIPGATTSALFISNLDSAQTGSYSVQVSIPAETTESASALVVIPAADLEITNFTIDTSGPAPAVSMDVLGADGMNVRLQASSNLSGWTDLGVFDGNAPILANDPAGAGARRRYYRVIVGP